MKYLGMFIALILVASTALAQSTVIADGLSNPRQISYGADGTLYIAEVGVGGTAAYVVDEDNTIMGGLTSQISAVDADGTHSVVVPWMPSLQTRQGDTGFRGAQSVLMTDDTLWLAIGEAGSTVQKVAPLMFTVMGLDPATLRIKHMADTYAGDLALNPDGSEEPGSDPVDLAMTDDGTLLIADANCNCLWSWTEADGLQVAASWSIDDNPVPTSVAVGPDGDIYVGFLSGFPFDEGSARVERWSGGELETTYGGLTLVTDIAVADDGTIYAVQLASGRGDQGFIPDSGSIQMVSESGNTPVAEGLNLPYGMAITPDGGLVVTINSTFTADPGQGSVVMIDQ